MTPQQFERLERLFEQAASLSIDARADFLAALEEKDTQVVRELETLLREDARIDDHTRSMADRLADARILATPGVPQRVGQYEILGVIGEGGMGAVYRARQQKPAREVALKLIRPGYASPKLIRRFDHEAELLGLLQHSGIAQIYEAGTHGEGSAMQPFFAMELVRGVPLSAHLTEQHIDTRGRLSLFIRICDAVEHAHQKGIVHRDIKPGNILVTADGQPKILDFGVARATDRDVQMTTMHTEVGQIVGTLPYMSPEQVSGDAGDVDTRSDVYALGVVLYEMLAGHLPYDLATATMYDAAQIIREKEPQRLSSVNTLLRGDVETIVAKALEKDRGRRYASAAALAEDIRRHLRDEPIEARPASALYQLGKLAKRHKALAAGVVIAVLALTIGMVTSTVLYLRAESARQGEARQRKLAETREAEALDARKEAEAARTETEQRAEELQVVTEFQQSMLRDIDAEMMGRGIIGSLGDGIRERMESAGAGPAEVQAALASFDELVGSLNATNLALEVVDENVLSRTVATIDQEFEDQPATRASLQQTVADTYQILGMYEPALPLQEASLRTRRRELGDGHPSTLASIKNMGVLLQSMGRLDEAEPFYREALEGRRRALGDDHPETLTSLNNMGSLLSLKGKLAEAEPYYLEALEVSRRVLGDDHPRTLLSMNNMGSLLFRMGKYAEAVPYYREALDGRRRVLGDDHQHTLLSINNMAAVLLRMRKFAEAESYQRAGLENNRRTLGDTHPNTLTSINNMGVLLKQLGKITEAEPFYREALEGRKRELGQDHPATLTTTGNYAALLSELGQHAKAEPYFRDALEGRRRVLGPDHPRTIQSISSLGNLLNKTERYREAADLLREGQAAARRAWSGPRPAAWGIYLSQLGEALIGLGAHSEAEATLLEAHALMAANLGDDHARTRDAVDLLIKLYESWHAAEPNKGYTEKAAEWQARLAQDDAAKTRTP